MLITGLDHIVLICPDIEEGVETYTDLLGRAADWRASAGGAATALFNVENTSLELMAPDGEGPVAKRLRELLAVSGPRLTSLAFRTEDIGAAHHKLQRRGLKPGDIVRGESRNALDGATRSWDRFRCDDTEMAGIKTFILQPHTLPEHLPSPQAGVSRLDHIVISTPNPLRALANYGGRLGLGLALARTAEQWKTRFLFFRTGGLTFEVIHRLDEAHDADEADSIWGLTWAVDDLHAAHVRLSASGVDVSEIRTGRKPGSHVFTVKSGTLNVPTLFISHSPR
ncbi:VOC family protein [Henriciella sp. AS95]|uniref:VOC family protein n=1 Tax=Henriciella sp. AS95 TaxID=3135782 RepID=UPI003182796C